MGGRFRPNVLRVYRPFAAVDDVVVDAVLDIGRRVRRLKQTLVIRFILGEKQSSRAVTVQETITQFGVRGGDHTIACPGWYLLEHGPRDTLSRGPNISEPERRKQIERSGLGPAIENRDSNQDVFRSLLGVFHQHIEIAILFKDASIDQLVLKFVPRSFPVGFYQVVVWERSLRIFVEIFHVGVRWCAVQIEVVLLNIFAVITFAVCQAEEALFQDGVLAVPQRQGKAEILSIIGNTGEPIFAPAICARSCLVVTEIVPGMAILTVVFANCAPLTLTEVWPPFFPRYTLQARLFQACCFCSFAHDAASLGLSPGLCRIIQHNPLQVSLNRVLRTTKRRDLFSTFFAMN